ncbi:MAG: type II secretion system F family protein [archaeon]
MSVSDLRVNISEAKKIIGNIRNLSQQMKYSDPKGRSFIIANMNSSFSRLVLINRAIPDIVKNISAVKKLESNSTVNSAPEKNVVNFKYTSLNSGSASVVSLKKEDKTKFLKELSLSETNLKKMSSSSTPSTLRPNLYAVISNKVFGALANSIAGNFSDLKKDLQDSNSRFLLPTYISMAFFTTLLSFIGGFLLLVLIFLLKMSVIAFFWIPLVPLLVVPVAFYLIPSANKSSIDKEIANELPFAVIYMAAIAGSNIEPTKIFRIIAESSEYKYVGIEMKKIISQVEIYGYDLVTALKNVAKLTINQRFAEVLNGMATNISSGSSLKNFLEKKSEGLLMDYKLDRNKYNEVAATFMDVYISVLITAPLILVMMVVIMSLTNLKFGNLSTDALLYLSIGGVALINVIFLIFLQMKQPKV